MSEDSDNSVQQETERISLPEFLEGIAPSQLMAVARMARGLETTSGSIYDHRFRTPDIQLHCSHESCNGTRFFRCIDDGPSVSPASFKFFYLTYRCGNCQNVEKTFSIAARLDEEGGSGQCYKFGESPTYGPPTPSRLIKLIGPDRETFLKGRRCENQGLGIGAFVYYRRVVENQKNRILAEIIKVANKLSVSPDLIAELEAAKAETQFSRALASVKGAMPQALLLNGENPLTLLHSALSDGLHDQSDEHCLEIATSVRVILGELSERLAQALKDEAELKAAISKLRGVKKKGRRTSPEPR